MELIHERIEEAKQDVANNKVSPIIYFMELNKMDLQVLAAYVGMWQWRVKRHAKPKIFKTLSESVLKKYADAFGISVDELKTSTVKINRKCHSQGIYAQLFPR
jgi:hypothetical protein